MPRTARASVGGLCYHAINRGNARARVFHDDRDYRTFVSLMQQASERVHMRVPAWCVMPNHFHLVLWPFDDDDLGRWMHWLLTSHVRRHHKRYGTDGRIWQGRFKAFPIEHDRHLLTVMRYVERNPVRAGLVELAQEWKWSSLFDLEWGHHALALDSPVERAASWTALVNAPQDDGEEAAIRCSILRSRPYGGRVWTVKTAKTLGLQSSLNRSGPRNSNSNT